MAKRLTSGSRNRPPPRENRLLAALPPADYKRIAALLDVVSLKLKSVLHKPGEPIRHVYFPGNGFCSILTVLEDGNMVEVATIGNEGMVGTSMVLDGSPPSSTTMVQGEGDTCYRMTAGAFRDEMNRRGAFYDLLTRFAQAFVGFVMQSTACNAVHSIEQRLARWLLMARDRMGGDNFPLTQEFVAMMLGATRPTVTVVAGTLQRAGLITYHRGHVTILDGRKLEASSCECYRTATNLLRSVTDGDRTTGPR
jgi:CRP-like cAMP-binding protein